MVAQSGDHSQPALKNKGLEEEEYRLYDEKQEL